MCITSFSDLTSILHVMKVEQNRMHKCMNLHTVGEQCEHAEEIYLQYGMYGHAHKHNSYYFVHASVTTSVRLRTSVLDYR